MVGGCAILANANKIADFDYSINENIKQTRYYFLFTICLIAIVSCEPFNLAEANFPEVITGAGTPFTSSVTFESEVSGIQNGFLVDQCGHALFTESVSTPDFSLAFSIETSDGQCGKGSYENTFIDLQSNQTYFCRAFIQKDGKTIWGEEVSINIELSLDGVAFWPERGKLEERRLAYGKGV